MKLNKSELNAIASRIRDNVNQAHEADQKRLDEQSDIDNLPTAQSIRKALLRMKPEVRDYIDSKTKYSVKFEDLVTIEHILPSLRTIKSKIQRDNSYNCSSIIQELIIEQIGCQEVQELINKVSKKYDL